MSKLRRGTRIYRSILHVRCRDCGEWKPTVDFHKAPPCADGTLRWKSYCKPCDTIRSRAAYLRHMRGHQKNTTFVSCRLCKYPTRKCDLDNGMCLACRALLADGGLHSTDSPWHCVSNNHPGHETRMEIFEACAAVEQPLFPRRR